MQEKSAQSQSYSFDTYHTVNNISSRGRSHSRNLGPGASIIRPICRTGHANNDDIDYVKKTWTI